MTLKGEPLDFLQYDDINTVTGALKLFFRELEDPSIPFAMYDKFLEAMSKFRTIFSFYFCYFMMNVTYTFLGFKQMSPFHDNRSRRL